MRRIVWLAHPSADVAPLFEVRNNPTRVVYRIDSGEVPVQVLVGPSPTGTQGIDYQWVPLVRAGVPVVLRPGESHYIEFISGYYRLDPSAIGPGMYIMAVEDEASTDSKGLVLVEASKRVCNRDVPS